MFPLENLIFYIFSKIERGIHLKTFYRILFVLSCEYCRYFDRCIPSLDFIKKKGFLESPDLLMLLNRMARKDRTIILRRREYFCTENRYNPILFTEEEKKLFNRVLSTYCHQKKKIDINLKRNPVWQRAAYDKKLCITKNNLRSLDVFKKGHRNIKAGCPLPGT